MRKTIILAVLAAWACGSSPDTPFGPDAKPHAFGAITLTVTALQPAGAQRSANVVADDAGNVPLDAVDAIAVTVEAVEVRPASGGPWVGLDVAVEGGVLINLVALDEADVVIATAELPAGDYIAARLFVQQGGMLLNREVCLGDSNHCLSEGMEHPIRIPSAENTGIKTDAHFSISEGGAEEVTLAFDVEATVRSLAWAPSLGRVIMAPVLRAVDEEDGGDDGGSEE